MEEERNINKASNTRRDAEMIIFVSNTHINLYWGKCILYLGEKRDGGGKDERGPNPGGSCKPG